MLSNSEVAVFCRQSAMILKSGLSIMEGMAILEEERENQNSGYGEIYGDIRKNLEETGIFYEALDTEAIFPPYMVWMVKIGEETGNLDKVMGQLADYYEREENMAADIKSAVAYPLMILCMMLVVLAVMIIKVIPVFAKVYEQLGSRPGGVAGVLFSMGSFMQTHWELPVIFLCLLAAGVWWLLKTRQGMQVFRKATERFFSRKSIGRKRNTSRISSVFSMALSSGTDYVQAAEMAGSFVQADEEMTRKITECTEKLLRGEQLSEALRDTGFYSPLQSRMLRIAERTGQMETAFCEIATQLDEEITAGIQNFVSVLEPTLVVVLSVMAGGILLSVMMPLMGILSLIG